MSSSSAKEPVISTEEVDENCLVELNVEVDLKVLVSFLVEVEEATEELLSSTEEDDWRLADVCCCVEEVTAPEGAGASPSFRKKKE